jgi:hypothetical protein
MIRKDPKNLSSTGANRNLTYCCVVWSSPALLPEPFRPEPPHISMRIWPAPAPRRTGHPAPGYLPPAPATCRQKYPAAGRFRCSSPAKTCLRPPAQNLRAPKVCESSPAPLCRPRASGALPPLHAAYGSPQWCGNTFCFRRTPAMPGTPATPQLRRFLQRILPVFAEMFPSTASALSAVYHTSWSSA